MSQFLHIHPDNPQPRLIRTAVEIMHAGGVIAYPTDSSYALGCHIGDKNAMQRIARIRQFDKSHHFTLVCRDLSEISSYAKVDNASYRLLKAHTPGAYTFILKATREVPKRLQNPKRKTIGLRVPDNEIAQALLEELGEPIMSTTLSLPGDDYPLSDPYDIEERLKNQLDAIIDGGNCGLDPTSIIDLVEGVPKVLRAGKGDISDFV
ncbi:MAG: threonylcarbamoyl-AMP synthase [Gammaproteobacteria bacterium]|nr:threonylcarbamoyl-AMP synthase [Gammaproteobacteria bacterium]NNC97639.1 threonylcarbamoyl-AMP synthase [Gammaproteobacteria bacterium]NNM13192.1 threonylcarbamoyl-AMP synthase [Gammaproteobacteria bacterium]